MIMNKFFNKFKNKKNNDSVIKSNKKPQDQIEAINNENVIIDNEESNNDSEEKQIKSFDKYKILLDEQLNKEQNEAATWEGDHVLVLAGAGCGKTKTIIARAQFLIEYMTSAEKVQILTFTRKSASEIVERVKNKLGEKANNLKASTFHTWCMSLIRKAPDLFGCKGFTVIDRDDQLTIFRLARSSSKKSKNPLIPRPGDLCDIYSYGRNVGCSLKKSIEIKSPESIDEFDEISKIVRNYEEKKELRKYIDYDDILDIVATQFNNYPEILNWISSNYTDLLIDEFQDTNPLQWKLINPLVSKLNLFCVGDDAQSIYGFRGADFQSIHKFNEKVPGSSVLKLSLNYRSTQEILDLSNWLLGKSHLKYDKKLIAYRGKGILPTVETFTNEWEEASWIVENLKEHREEGERWDENMILCRTGFSARALEGALIESKIPYVFIGGRKLFETAHVKDVLSALRIIANPQDDLGWMRYLLLWGGVGDKTASTAISQITKNDSLDQSIEILKRHPKISLESLEILKQGSLAETTEECFKICVDGLFKVLENKYKNKNWEQRIKDFDVIQRLSQATTSILEFLEAYILEPIYLTEALPKGNEDDVVTVITIHSAKGAECKRCYVLNVSPGGYPISRSMNSGESIEEERRVLYVAMTRAKDELIITRSGNFSSASSSSKIQIEDKKYERYFLSDIKDKLFKNNDHRLLNDDNLTDGSFSRSFPKPSTKIDLE